MNENYQLAERCLFYGLPGSAILAISLLVSLHVGNDFHQDVFTKSITFAGSNIALWVSYLLIFQTMPMEVANVLIWNKTSKHADNTIPQDVGEPQEQIATVVTAQCDTSNYEAINQRHEQEAIELKEQMLSAIFEYVNEVMSPFLREPDLPLLCEEIRSWANDVRHTPRSFSLKEPLDRFALAHFIWNIGERLDRKVYSGNIRAIFVKSLFPDALKTVSIDTLRNFKTHPERGPITLDEPSAGSFAFHYDRMSRKQPIREPKAVICR